MSQTSLLARGIGYNVATPVYEGPLDLLLALIERAELDITKLALAQVTDQFLDYIRNLDRLQVEQVSAFLVIAARLLQIKSEVLLPRPPVRPPGEEDPGEALARQLRIYRRYREIAMLLEEREQAGLRTYLRVAPTPKAEGTVDLSEVTLEDLRAAARAIFSRIDITPTLDEVVAPYRITIREKIGLISRALRRSKTVTFRELLEHSRNRLDIVVTFLALLELVKQYLVLANQESLFGDISLEPTSLLGDEQEFELEFGE